MQFLSLFTTLLHFLPSEISHSLALKGLNLCYRIGLIDFLSKNERHHSGNLENNFEQKDEFLGKFSNPLGIAAGLDKNGDYIDSLAALGVGFIEIGTVTPRSQEGNDKPRLFRDKKNLALVNRMGFNNKGLEYLINNVKNRKSKIPLGISIGKNFDTPIEEAYLDYLECLDKVYPYADYLAVNISSPNTTNLRALSSKEYLNDLLGKLKKLQKEKSKKYNYRPIFIKISPDETKETILDICNSVKEISIDGLICTNTSLNHDGNFGAGGISGAPLMKSSTEVLSQVRSIMGESFPIIATGGVLSAQDYKAKIQAGANLVQIYTGFIYKGPKLIQDIFEV